MNTPTYEATVVVGGDEQDTLFSALPRPRRSATNGIVTRQSGRIILTFEHPDGTPFDIDAAGLSGTNLMAVPFNSDVTPVVLGVGTTSGAGMNIYTADWVRDTIPDSWSTFAQDADGAIVMYIELEETGVADYFQTYTRFNVFDGSFSGDMTNLPLVIFRYTWENAIASEWAQFNRGTPLFMDDALAYLAGVRRSDWGATVDKDLVTSPVGVDNEQYIIAGIGGDWSLFTINDIVRYSLTDLIWYARTPIDGDEVFVADENSRYRYDGAAWAIVATGGEVNTASNVGGFADVFKQKTAQDLEFKTLQSSDASVTITQNTDDIDFTVVVPTGAGGILPEGANSVKTADYTVIAGDITAGVVIELGTATVADRIFTIDVSLLSITDKINFKNTSDFRLQIIVSNTGTMTINDIKTDLFLWKGDGLITLNGETATNCNTIAGY